MDREKVIGHLNDCMEASRRDNTWVFVRKDIVEDAIALLKEQEAVVRCKDCKHRPKQTEPPKTYGFSVEFPEGSKCPCQCDDGFYSWYPNDDWFCADGEKTDDKK